MSTESYFFAVSDAAPTLATTPTRIEQADARHLAITWGDGIRQSFDVRELRLACGCAQCVDEWSGENRLDPAVVAQDVHPLQIEGVGRYALQITWSDGHSSGIYPFRRLRELGERTEPTRNEDG